MRLPCSAFVCPIGVPGFGELLTFSTSPRSLRVGFNYVPRTRPHIPGPSQFASFIAAVKQSPEEWAAFVNDIPRREDPTNREVQHTQDTALGNGETITSSVGPRWRHIPTAAR